MSQHSQEPPGDSGQFFETGGVSLHYERLGREYTGSPILFLHEGLGSVELWRDFPRELVEATRRPGLAYSRHGNGWSSPPSGERGPGYMHEEALEVLPRLIDDLVGRPPILVGHSDGASIALIHAGSGHPVEGLVLIAPHVFVEPETVDSISSLRTEYPESEMPEKMTKYHTDPEGTFYAWADIWLSRQFRSWNIEGFLAGVACPVLLIQGDEDEYGTMRQIEAIAAGLTPRVETLVVEGAEHSPHLSHTEEVVAAVARFVEGLG